MPSPKKPVCSNKQAPPASPSKKKCHCNYFKWTEKQWTWVAHWMVDNRTEYNAGSQSWAKKYEMILDTITAFAEGTEGAELFEPIPKWNHVKRICEGLHKQYNDARRHINSSGEGLTEEESLIFNNLWGTSTSSIIFANVY